MNILSLTYLRAVLHAVCLLYKEHVSVILWGLHDLGSGSSIFNIHSKAFVWWRALWAMVISMRLILTTHLVILTMLSFGSLGSSISSSEPTKTWRVHLFLQQIAGTGVMNIRVILQPLHQIILRIIWAWTMSIKWASSSRFVIHRAAVDHVIYKDPLYCHSWLHSLTSSCGSMVIRKRLLLLHLKVMKNFFHIILIIHIYHILLFALFSSLLDSSVCSLYCMLISSTGFGSSRHVWAVVSVVDAWSRNAVQMLSCVEASAVNVLIGADRHVSTLVNSCLSDGAVAEVAVVLNYHLCGWFVEGATLRMHQLIIFV